MSDSNKNLTDSLADCQSQNNLNLNLNAWGYNWATLFLGE
jgi:hypothetical protein